MWLSFCAISLKRCSHRVEFSKTPKYIAYVWQLVVWCQERVEVFSSFGSRSDAWSIWLHKNDIVFEKKKINSSLQVIYAVTHQLHSWDILQRSEMQGIAVVVCSRWPRSSFPRRLDGGLVYGLTVISCCFFVILYAVCLLVRQRLGVLQSLCINSM
jgi:hypothetical protein